MNIKDYNEKEYISEEEKLWELPLIPLRGLSLFPETVIHFDVGREKSKAAIDYAMEHKQQIMLITQRELMVEDPEPEDLYEVGTRAIVKQILKMPGDIIRVLVEVKERLTISSFMQFEPFIMVEANEVHNQMILTKEEKALLKMVKEAFYTYMGYGKNQSTEMLDAIEEIEEPNKLIDIIGSNLMIDVEQAQVLLSETDVRKRLEDTYTLLVDEIEILEMEKDIDSKVKSQLDKHQKEYYLREQIKAIQEELGEDQTLDQVDDYLTRLKALNLEESTHKKVEKEIQKLNKTPSGSSEASVIQTYIEWILDLPWNKETDETIDIKNAREILDADHYALDKVKERVLEYLAVLKLSQKMTGPILCLVGPPGVGKTSIAKSIARALDRNFVRMSLGGMRDEAEIRGHRRTYVGAIPGRIIYNLKQAGSKNPLFLLDEIDKMSNEFRGDPASALLEVLDPEQNSTFTDNYLELPFDLSKVMFITTANSVSTIPRPLLDRMEIIEVSGYIEEEKLNIAKKYLLPKQLEKHGLKKSNIIMGDQTVRDVINYYTRESGVRELERQIARICRGVAKNIVENDKKRVSVTAKNLDKYLGKKKYRYEIIEKDARIGVVNGLAWTSVGGDTLQVEAVAVQGKGQIELTGKLGDVMKESAKTGISYIRSIADQLKIDPEFYKNNDIHLHVPEGAIPKDGPSAGITITTAVISVLTKEPVTQNLAMTGEITLRGRVLPIGGLKEKLLAAHRAGISQIIIPADNNKDLEEIPEEILKKLTIHQVSSMQEVIDLVFNGGLK